MSDGIRLKQVNLMEVGGVALTLDDGKLPVVISTSGAEVFQALKTATDIPAAGLLTVTSAAIPIDKTDTLVAVEIGAGVALRGVVFGDVDGSSPVQLGGNHMTPENESKIFNYETAGLSLDSDGNAVFKIELHNLDKNTAATGYVNIHARRRDT